MKNIRTGKTRKANRIYSILTVNVVCIDGQLTSTSEETIAGNCLEAVPLPPDVYIIEVQGRDFNIVYRA